MRSKEDSFKGKKFREIPEEEGGEMSEMVKSNAEVQFTMNANDVVNYTDGSNALSVTSCDPAISNTGNCLTYPYYWDWWNNNHYHYHADKNKNEQAFNVAKMLLKEKIISSTSVGKFITLVEKIEKAL